MKIFALRKWRKTFLNAVFSHSRKRFLKFPHKILVIILHNVIGFKNFQILSANHNPEVRCIICTGVIRFVLMLHLNCTALGQSECIIMSEMSSSHLFRFGIATLAKRNTHGTFSSKSKRDSLAHVFPAFGRLVEVCSDF